MKPAYYINLLFLLALLGCSTESEIMPEDVFVKYFGSQDEQRAVDFQINEAGEFIIFGTRRIDDETANDFFMLRVDQEGNLINDATLGIEDDEGNANNDLAHRIKVIPQGFLIVGSTAPLNEAFIAQDRLLYWAHLDESFNVITQVIDTVSGGLGNLEGADILLTSGDSVVISGTTDAFEANQSGTTVDGTTKLFLGKWSLNGNLGWKKTYGFAGSNDASLAVFERSNSDLLLFGVTDEIGSNGEAGQNVVVYQINQFGTSPVGEVPKYGTNGDDLLNRVVRIDGGYALVGTSFVGNVSNPFLIILDEDARLVSSTNLVFDPEGAMDPNNSDPFDGFGLGVSRAANNDFVVVGRVLDFESGENENEISKNNEMMFMRTTQTGEQIMESASNFGLVAGNDEAVSAMTLNDGSIVVLGTSDFGSGVTLITLIKMNVDGFIKE